MRFQVFGGVAVAMVLTACGTVTDESFTPQVLQTGFYAGERYQLRQRTIEGRNGPFQQTSVVYYGYTRNCLIDSPNDCEFAARELISEVNESFF
jgi:hypothetical protein